MTTAVVTRLDAAIDQGKKAVVTATDNDEFQAAVSALEAELAAFTASIQTGTKSSGGEGPVPSDPDPELEVPVFRDVPENAWYREAVEFVVKNGLFNGVGKEEFAPNSPMTRAMLMRLLAADD